jgi:hypothetical protein
MTATTSSCCNRLASLDAELSSTTRFLSCFKVVTYARLSVVWAWSTTPMLTEALPPPMTLPSSTMRKMGMSKVKMSAARLRKLLRTVALTSANHPLTSAVPGRSAR